MVNGLQVVASFASCCIFDMCASHIRIDKSMISLSTSSSAYCLELVALEDNLVTSCLGSACRDVVSRTLALSSYEAVEENDSFSFGVPDCSWVNRPDRMLHN